MARWVAALGHVKRRMGLGSRAEPWEQAGITASAIEWAVPPHLQSAFGYIYRSSQGVYLLVGRDIRRVSISGDQRRDEICKVQPWALRRSALKWNLTTAQRRGSRSKHQCGRQHSPTRHRPCPI